MSIVYINSIHNNTTYNSVICNTEYHKMPICWIALSQLWYLMGMVIKTLYPSHLQGGAPKVVRIFGGVCDGILGDTQYDVGYSKTR